MPTTAQILETISSCSAAACKCKSRFYSGGSVWIKHVHYNLPGGLKTQFLSVKLIFIVSACLSLALAHWLLRLSCLGTGRHFSINLGHAQEQGHQSTKNFHLWKKTHKTFICQTLASDCAQPLGYKDTKIKLFYCTITIVVKSFWRNYSIMQLPQFWMSPLL